MNDSSSNASGSKLSLVVAVVTSVGDWDDCAGDASCAGGRSSRPGATAFLRVKLIDPNLKPVCEMCVKWQKSAPWAAFRQPTRCSHCAFGRFLAPDDSEQRAPYRP